MHLECVCSGQCRHEARAMLFVFVFMSGCAATNPQQARAAQQQPSRASVDERDSVGHNDRPSVRPESRGWRQ